MIEVTNTLPLGTILWDAQDGRPLEPDPALGIFEYTICEPVDTEPTHSLVRQKPEFGYIAVKYRDKWGATRYSYVAPDELEVGDMVVHSLPEGSVPSTDKRYELTDAPDWNFGVLALAAQFSREVHFTYVKNDGLVVEQRRIVPEAIHAPANGRPYVVGHDPDRDDVRAFRLDRIKGTVSA